MCFELASILFMFIWLDTIGFLLGGCEFVLPLVGPAWTYNSPPWLLEPWTGFSIQLAEVAHPDTDITVRFL